MADPGVESRRRMQIGLESVSGTAVAATAIIRGPAEMIKDESTHVRPPDNVGYRVDTNRMYTSAVGASLAMPSREATFEQIGWAAAASLQNVVTGTPNGGSTSAYIYTRTLPYAGDASFRSFTIEAGDNQQAYHMAYAFCEQWGLSGVIDQAVMITQKWRGRQKIKNAFTGSLSPLAVEEILFNKGKIYCDVVGGTLGGTQLTNTWLGFDITINPGLKAQASGDGQLYFSFVKGVKPLITGKFIFEHDAIGVARVDDFEANTTKKFRLDFAGSALSGTGGTHATKLERLDFCANIDSIDDGAQDGNDIITVNWTAVYDATATLYFVETNVNLLSALP